MGNFCVFSITSSSDRYLTYTLRDERANSSVDIVPERGGMVVTAKIADVELFYLDADRFANPELSVRGGNPFLFPICGNVPGDRYTWKDTTYELKQHGFGRTLPWMVDKSETTDAEAALTVLLKDSPDTLAVYPFRFEVRLTYRWAGSALTVDQDYRNTSAEPMPFSYGFHPYFATSDKSALEFELPNASYFDRANQVNATWPDTQWNFDLDEIDAAFDALPNDQPITTAVSDRDRNLKLTMTTGGASRHLVFWTVKGKPFYCLEPWSGPRNSINTGTDLIVLKPGDTHRDRLILHWSELSPS